MPPGRPQVFGLSKDVTLAVLPRLYMEEVLTELGRRDIDYRQVLITTLHDVMVREYQQLDSQSGPTTPDVTCHVTRRVGYGGMYDPWPWAGELVGRRGAPIEMYIESYSEGDTHTDAPTDLSMRSVNSKELKDPERRDTRERYHITTARRTDEEQWNHEQAYTRYNSHRQEMSHDSMPQATEIRHILERPSSEDENPSPLESREEYGRHLSTSPVSQDGEYRCREQEETNGNATLSSDASASPDTGQSLNSNATTSTTCTVPERTPSGSGDQVEENTDDPGRLVSIERYIRWRSRKGYSRKKITHNLPTLPVPQHLLSSNQELTETDDSPLNVSTASVQKKPKGKRKDACESLTDGGKDEAASSKRPKRRASSDLTVRHANGPTEPPVSEEQTSPFRRPSETQIVQYRDLSIDPPSEDQILPYWTQPKGSPLHIEWVSSLKNGSAESWKKGIEGEGKSEKDLPGSKSSTPPESSENSAATSSDFSSSEMPSLPVTLNMLATRRHPQQLDIGVDPAKQQPRASQSQKIIATYPKQQEDNKAPAEQEQAKSNITNKEAAPTARQPEHGDAITSQSSLPTSLQEAGASLQGGERTSQTRNHSLQQFALPGMWQRKEMDTSPYAVATGTTSKMPLDTNHSYQTERESGRKHLTISKEVVASFQRLEEARLRGFSGTRVDSNHPGSKCTEKGDKKSQEGMPPDIAASDPKEPSHEAMDSNAQDSVLSSVLREAVIYKKREEHIGKTSMESLHSSSIPAGPTERQLQTSDKPQGLRPAVSSYRPETEAHMEPMSSEPSTSSERRPNHQTAEVCGPSVPFPYRRQSDNSPGTQAHDGPPSAASTSHEVMPGFQKLVQINGSTVWVPRAFAAVSPLTFPPAHVNPGRTSHEHQSSPSSHEAQVENTDRRLQREPVPMEPQEAIPARHQVDNARVGPREHQTSAEPYPYQEQPPDFVTQRDINLVIKQEPLSPLSDSVNEEERELIQGVLSGASLTESLEQQMLNSGDAPRDMDGQDGSEQQTGADEGSSSATSDVTDGGRKWQKLYHCPLCSYFTRHRGNVKQHVRVHTRERPFKCPLCDYTGARKEHVQVHMKRHTGERPFKCDHCDYRTSRKPDLVKHLRTHSGDRPYACPKCAYRAAVQSALVNHLRTHTGEKPYKCPFCNHCSARRRELAKHMGKHSEEEKNRAVEQYSRR